VRGSRNSLLPILTLAYSTTDSIVSNGKAAGRDAACISIRRTRPLAGSIQTDPL